MPNQKPLGMTADEVRGLGDTLKTTIGTYEVTIDGRKVQVVAPVNASDQWWANKAQDIRGTSDHQAYMQRQQQAAQQAQARHAAQMRSPNATDVLRGIAGQGPAKPQPQNRMGLAGRGRGSEDEEDAPESMQVGPLKHTYSRTNGGQTTSKKLIPTPQGAVSRILDGRFDPPESMGEILSTPFGLGNDFARTITPEGNDPISALGRAATGFATPASALLGGAAGLASAASPVVGRVLSGVFAAQQVGESVNQAAQGHPFDAALNLALGGLAGKHAITGGVHDPLAPPAPQAAVPEAAKPVTETAQPVTETAAQPAAPVAQDSLAPLPDPVEARIMQTPARPMGEASAAPPVSPTNTEGAPASPQVEASRAPRRFVRYDEEGDTPSLGKPHGLYVAPEGIESAHSDVGPVKSEWELAPDAKVLSLEEYPPEEVAMRRGAIGAGAGVHAARELLGAEEFSRLRGLSKPDLIAWADNRFPNTDHSGYVDTQEVMEAIGAQLAREKGYDAIDLPDRSDPSFSETVLLNDQKARPARPPVSPTNTEGAPAPAPVDRTARDKRITAIAQRLASLGATRADVGDVLAEVEVKGLARPGPKSAEMAENLLRSRLESGKLATGYDKPLPSPTPAEPEPAPPVTVDALAPPAPQVAPMPTAEPTPTPAGPEARAEPVEDALRARGGWLARVADKLTKGRRGSGGGLKADVDRAINNGLSEHDELVPKAGQLLRQYSNEGPHAAIARQYTETGVSQAYGGDPEKVQMYLDARDHEVALKAADDYRAIADSVKTTAGFRNHYQDVVDLLEELGKHDSVPSDAAQQVRDMLAQEANQRNAAGQIIPPKKTAALAVKLLRNAADEAEANSAWSRAGRSKADYQAFTADPAYQEANAWWKGGIGRAYEESHAQAGGVQGHAVGDSGYFPSLAKSDEGQPIMGKLSDKPIRNDRVANRFYNTRLASNGYEPTFDAMENHLRRTLLRNTEKQYMDAMVEGGGAERYALHGGKWVQTVRGAKGEWIPTDANGNPGKELRSDANGGFTYLNPGTNEAVNGKIVESRTPMMIQGAGLVPQPKYLMPEWAQRENGPVLDPSQQWMPGSSGRMLVSGLNAASVAANVSELGTHMMNQTGTHEAFAPPTYGSFFQRALSWIPGELKVPFTKYAVSAKRLVHAAQLTQIDPTSEESYKAKLGMARLGLLNPHNVKGVETDGKLQWLGNKALGGPSGFMVRNQLLAWKMLDHVDEMNAKAGGQPLSDQARFEYMRRLGLYNQAINSGLERGLKKTGVNPFATARFAQMRNGFKQWLGMVGKDDLWNELEPSLRKKYKINQALGPGSPAYKALGAYIGWQLWAGHVNDDKDSNHEAFKTPDFTGGVGKIQTPFTRGFIGEPAMGAYNALQTGKDPGQGFMAGVANTLIPPLAGPVISTPFAAGTGKIPYFSTGRGGVDLMRITPPDEQAGTLANMYHGSTGANSTLKFGADVVAHLFGWFAKPEKP